jgi:hypothetical protein
MYIKSEAAITVFELLVMSSVSLKMCWAIKKHWINKFYYMFASCCFFLWDLYYDAGIHEHQVLTTVLLCAGFTMYTTCVIWLAFVPLYFGTGNHVPLRITSMSVTISLSASVTLACLFSPKLYIILVHSERNVRQSMMPVSS